MSVCLIVAALFVRTSALNKPPLHSRVLSRAFTPCAPRSNMDVEARAEPRSMMDIAGVEAWFAERGMKDIHFSAAYRHLFRTEHAWTAPALHALAGLKLTDAVDLCAAFAPSTSRVVETVESEGGRKFLIELQSGRRVEAVLIRHETHTSGVKRATVCVSSQVGCARGCAFCATGTMGMLQQLSAAEILEQVWHIRRALRADDSALSLRNVVFMGMGEPLDNLDAVIASLAALQSNTLFNLAAKRCTVSTVGASPFNIRRLADEAPRSSLAISLHSATQSVRDEIVPASCDLGELADAMDYHSNRTGAAAMVEYLLIQGVNDSPAEADALAAFCKARSANNPRASRGFCNLIPYNPTSAGDLRGYETPTDESIRAFHRRLRDEHDINALVRWSSATGRDADGACGQLFLDEKPRPRNPTPV